MIVSTLSIMSEIAEQYRLLIADVYELAGASRRTSEAVARDHGQTVARWHVMSVLDGAELSAAQIARARSQVNPGYQRRRCSSAHLPQDDKLQRRIRRVRSACARVALARYLRDR